MAKIEPPSISISSRTNEQNMQIVKSWCSTLADQLNYESSERETRISSLEAEVSELKSTISKLSS